MGKFIDLVGQRFDMLTVVERVYPNTIANKARWRCLCDCGNEVIRISGDLKNGKNQSCGCLQSRNTVERNKKGTIDLTGQRFGRWLVIERGKEEDKKTGGAAWLCRCDCGVEKEVSGYNLRNGISLSCGCYATELLIDRLTTHNLTHSPVYNTHRSMLHRCLNPENENYKNYGGRGIKICNEWLELFNFDSWALLSGYKPGLTIERIDNDGNYCPENCTWIPKEEQPKNRRSNQYLTLRGETKTKAEWIRILNIPKSTLDWRLKHGRTIEEALTPGKQKTRSKYV
jgi:hypothetical protein